MCAPRVRIYESCELLSSSDAGDDIPQLLLYFLRRPPLPRPTPTPAVPVPPSPPPPPNASDSVDSIVLLLLLLFFVPREFKSHHAIFELISQPGFDASELSLDDEDATAAGGDGDRGAGTAARADDVSDSCATAAAATLLVFRRRFVVAAVSRYALIFLVGVMIRRKPDFRRRCRAAAESGFVDTFCDSTTSSAPPAFGIRTSSMPFEFAFVRLLCAEWWCSLVVVDVRD